MLSFVPAELPGIVVVEPELITDSRGFFARTYCEREFHRHGLEFVPVQESISFNNVAGTVRGLHYQAPPHAEAKLVRCTMGSVFDVAVDVRRGSPTYGRWVGTELSAANRRAVYIPEGFAHGFQTLENRTEVLYLISAEYVSESRRGIRFDDPTLGIEWPASTGRIVSDRDLSLPLLGDASVSPVPP